MLTCLWEGCLFLMSYTATKSMGAGRERNFSMDDKGKREKLSS